MADEYFYGITLKGKNAHNVWDPDHKGDDYPRTRKLIVKQCVLGTDANKDEYHVIQAETLTLKETIKTPIAILKVGEQRQVRLDLEFPDAPVTFTLIEGSGPVYLHGQDLLGELVEEIEEMDEMVEMEEMVDEEEAEEDEEEGNPKKKLKLQNNSKGAAKPTNNANNKNANNKKK